MGSLRENTQAAGGNPHQELEKSYGQSRKERIERHHAFFRTHTFQHWIHLRSGHVLLSQFFGARFQKIALSYNDLTYRSPLSSEWKGIFQDDSNSIDPCSGCHNRHGAIAESNRSSQTPDPFFQPVYGSFIFGWEILQSRHESGRFKRSGHHYSRPVPRFRPPGPWGCRLIKLHHGDNQSAI